MTEADPATNGGAPAPARAVLADTEPRPGGSTRQRTSGRIRYGRPQLLIAFLLILGPAAYLAASADRSHDPMAVRRQHAETTGMVSGWPASVQRRIYQVPLPDDATRVAFHESNSWKTSALYVRFTTTRTGLTTFLLRLKAPQAALADGDVTIPAARARAAGWRFGPGHRWSGIRLPRHGPAPDHRITVDEDDPAHPAVYLVATVTFH